MGTVTPDELLRLYTLEEITTEQAVGHIVQNLPRIQKLLEALRKELETLRKEAERLKAFVGMGEGKR